MYNIELREQKKLIQTDDGSLTLYSTEFDETYHSDRDGALYESLHKHVLPAFTIKSDRDEIKILDICFGIGYNTLATLYHIKNANLSTKVHIVSPEFDRGLIESLYSFDYPSEFDAFTHIIDRLSKEFYYEDKQFTIEILLGDARDSIPQLKDKFDIVYQDPFSPEHNPQLWTREYFQDIRKVSKADVILTTYSIAASVRMGLDESGFKLFLLNNKGIRDSMIASLDMLDGYEFIDMELKKRRNPTAKSLRDKALI
jgi:tRNA U34 5-methylaminomethyl-2-thiouridine-forming methyltransferase MnmC